MPLLGGPPHAKHLFLAMLFSETALSVSSITFIAVSYHPRGVAINVAIYRFEARHLWWRASFQTIAITQLESGASLLPRPAQ